MQWLGHSGLDQESISQSLDMIAKTTNKYQFSVLSQNAFYYWFLEVVSMKCITLQLSRLINSRVMSINGA